MNEIRLCSMCHHCVDLSGTESEIILFCTNKKENIFDTFKICKKFQKLGEPLEEKYLKD